MGGAVHHHNNGTHNPDSNPIEHTDNVIKPYNDEVTRRLNDMAKYGKGLYAATTHLVSVNVLNDSTEKSACGQ